MIENLSQNWRKLSKKLSPSPGTDSKASKKRKERKSQPDTKAIRLKVVEDLQGIKVSPIEYLLWTYDGDIEVSEALKFTGQKYLTTSSKPIPRKEEQGKYISMDCEFVGVGPEGTESVLARVSIVNFFGKVIYDKYVRPSEKVTDWRTWVSGVTPLNMKEAVSFREAQMEASKILEDRILVGHAIHHDLESLFLSHPYSKIRDTSKLPLFKKITGGRPPSLKKLILHYLKIEIQGGYHSSVEDARATMLLFRLFRKEFDKEIRQKLRKI